MWDLNKQINLNKPGIWELYCIALDVMMGCLLIPCLTFIPILSHAQFPMVVHSSFCFFAFWPIFKTNCRLKYICIFIIITIHTDWNVTLYSCIIWRIKPSISPSHKQNHLILNTWVNTKTQWHKHKVVFRWCPSGSVGNDECYPRLTFNINWNFVCCILFWNVLLFPRCLITSNSTI